MSDNAPDYNKNQEALEAARMGASEQQESSKTQESHQQNIHTAAEAAKNLATVATPMGAFSLLKQINLLSDMPYVAAMGAALLKDLLDFVTAETVVLSILTSGLCSIFIFMMLLLVGSSGKRKGASKFVKKIVFLIGGGIADSVPGIDFLPIETITVAAIYVLELMERKNA